MTKRLFVYGSLRQGEPNCPRFLGNSVFMREAVTEDRFKLTGHSYVPYAYPDPVQGHQLLGEVWEATDEDAAAVERLEVGADYLPLVTNVYIDGQAQPVTMYVNDNPFARRAQSDENGCVEWPRRG